MKNPIIAGFALLVVFALVLSSCSGRKSAESFDISSESTEESGSETVAEASDEVSEAAEMSGEENASEVQPEEMANPFEGLSCKPGKIAEIEAMGDFFVIQGGCAYGEYGYQAVTNNGYTQCIIVKYQLDGWVEVARSEPLALGHANDMTYCPETGELLVATLGSNGARIAVVDEATLTVKEYRKLGGLCGCYAIDYNETLENFITGTASVSIGFYDRDLNFLKLNMAAETDLVTQNLCSDRQYIYHVFYKGAYEKGAGKRNEVFIFDLDGNFITNLPLNIELEEPENISVVDGVFYVACNNSNWTGGTVYRMTIE